MSEQRRILDFLALAERLETELRHGWLSTGRQESVAEHRFQMVLMALLVHRHLAQPVDLCKVLERSWCSIWSRGSILASDRRPQTRGGGRAGTVA